MSDDYVAWCRYIFNESGGIETIETCDSDAKGAFKVYRAPVATTSRDDDLVHHVRRVLLYCSNFGDSVCICGDEQPKGTHDDECEDAQRLYERIATIRGGSG